MLVLSLLACGFGSEPSIGMVDGTFTGACASEVTALESDWADGLEADGCAYRVDAINSEATVHLVFDAPAFVDAAAGSPVDVTYTIPDETLVFSVETGCGFPEDVCDGADTSTVNEVWSPVSGTVHLTTAPNGDDATATLVFTDVVFEGTSGTASLSTTWTVDLYMGE